VPILTSRAYADPYTQADIPATASDVRSATFEQALNDLPGASLVHSIDLSFARSIPGAERYSPAEANFYMEERGLKGQFTFDRDYNELELQTLASRKTKELRRVSILQRAEGSGSSVVGRFGIALVSNFFDPIALGTAFVPVVGQARYAAMLERAGSAVGRAGVRVGVGAAEGAAGAAIVEPIIAGSKIQEQADYRFADSFMNIAIGTAFGGGLHVAGGALGDRLRPKRMAAELEQIEAAHTAVPVMTPAETELASRVIRAREELQAAEADILRQANTILDQETLTLRGTVDSPVSKSLDDGPAWSKLEDELTQQRAQVDAIARRVANDFEPAAVKAEIDKLARDAQLVRDLRTKYRQRNVSERIAERARENVVSRRTVLETKLAEQRLALADTEAKVNAHRSKNSAEQRLEFLRAFRSTDDARKLIELLPQEAAERLRGRLDAATKEASSLLDSPEVRALTQKQPPASWIASQADPKVREAALRARVAQAVTDDVGEIRPFFDRSTMEDAQARAMNVDERPLMDPAAVKHADAVIEAGESADLTIAKEALAESQARVKLLLDEMGLNSEQAAEFNAAIRADLEQVAEAAEDAKQLSRAAELMASCSLRHAA